MCHTRCHTCAILARQRTTSLSALLRHSLSGDTTPCKVTPVILHGVVSPDFTRGCIAGASVGAQWRPCCQESTSLSECSPRGTTGPPAGRHKKQRFPRTLQQDYTKGSAVSYKRGTPAADLPSLARGANLVAEVEERFGGREDPSRRTRLLLRTRAVSTSFLCTHSVSTSFLCTHIVSIAHTLSAYPLPVHTRCQHRMHAHTRCQHVHNRDDPSRRARFFL